MSDHQMARLGRMVDEALSEAGPLPATSGTPRTTSTEGYEGTATGRGARISYYAVEDICWIYQDRSMAENLRRYGWRQARRNVMRQGPLSKEWTSHGGRPPVRLTRKGVEVKLADGIQTFSWQRIQNQVSARRS
jgi:hypothetical protein